MKKKLLSAIGILCVFCVLIPIAYAGDVTTVESQLQAHIKELEDYLYTKQTDLKRLDALAEKFELTSGQRAKMMSLYCRALLHTEQESYNLARSEVALLLETEVLSDYIRELKSDFILDLTTLDKYIIGREAENRGDIAAAVKAYNGVFGFFDAMDRSDALTQAEWSERYDLALLYIERGKYEKAVIILTSLAEVDYKASKFNLDLAKKLLSEMPAKETPAPTPAPTVAPQPAVAPTPTPVRIVSFEITAEAKSNTYVALTWNHVDGASYYKVFRKRTKNESEAFADISGKISNATFTDSNTGSGYKFSYCAEAYDQKGNKVGESNKITIVTALATNAPTSKKTTPPPVTAAPVTAAPVTAAPVTAAPITAAPVTAAPVTAAPVTAAPVTQPPTVPPITWSAWSDWSETKPAEASTRQIESKEETRETTVTKYKYNRWRYKRTTTNNWAYSYAEYRGSIYAGEGSWQYTTSATPLKIDHYTDGRAVYTGIWYNQSTASEKVSTKVTLYRYRDQQ